MLLSEMLDGGRPLTATAVANGELDLPEDHFAFSKTAPLGKALEVVVRRALADRSRRFASGEELAEVLDRWERRAALPSAWTEKSSRAKAFAVGRSPAAWDVLVDELAVSAKRLAATFDAAEQLRQSVLDGGAGQDTGKDTGKDVARVRTSSTEGRAERERASDEGGPQRARTHGNAEAFATDDEADSGARAQETKSRRRLGSIGPELAAFAEKSRPKLRPWFVGGGIAAVLGGAGLLVSFYFDEPPAPRPASSSSVVQSREVTDAPRAKERPRASAREETSECIRSYFREDTLQKDVDLGFVCTEEDYLAVNRRLHEEATVPLTVPAAEPSTTFDAGTGPSNSAGAQASAAPSAEAIAASAPSANPALVVRSATANRGWHLGWYELVATAIIRQNCCKEAAPIKLPESTGWCQQLQGVVRRIAQDSAKVGDLSPGVRAFDESITCLLAQGKHVVYPYKAVPTSLQKAAFQQFLKHAAEVDAKRSSQR
ncbi:MAG: hypothetical protein QM784_26675 [Polyangiaceae bacterium]